MPQSLKNFYHFLNAVLANLFYGFPGKKLTVIGVTGTDGKTTTVNLIYSILQKAGKNVSMISSVGAKIGGKDYDLPFHVTTPSSWQLQRFLKMIVEEKTSLRPSGYAGQGKYLVLEVTSHALDQNRVWGIPFKVGVLTNITHEHLDYHKNFENYVKAKMKLFRGVEHAVINKEYRINNNYNHYNRFAQKLSAFQGGDYAEANVKASPAMGRQSGRKLKTGEHPGDFQSGEAYKTITYGLKNGDINLQNFSFTTTLPGEYNQLNCLAAAGTGKALGISEEKIREGIEGFKGIEGRFENFPTGKNFKVIIDFAHTPNALESLLSTLRLQVKGKIIHVFGSAGLRDQRKRPMMGQISGKYDDVIILTEEDYRTEDVVKIMEEIGGGINSKFQVPNLKQILILKIPNRQEAINKAINLAEKDDLVLLTGKGHEKSLCRGKKEYPWDEKEAVRKALGR